MQILNKPSTLFTASVRRREPENSPRRELCPHHTGKDIKIKSMSSSHPPALDCVANKDLIGEVGLGGALCGSGGHTSPPPPPPPQSKQSSPGTECRAASPGIAPRLWHRSQPYKARYGVRPDARGRSCLWVFRTPKRC